MISAEELRARQTAQQEVRKEQRAKEQAEFGDRFKTAADKYYEVIMAEAERAIGEAQKSTKPFVYLDFRPLVKDVEGLAYTTLLYGFWSKKEQRFDDSKFKELGVEKPLERATRDLDKLGYKLKDVSDSSKSHRLFIKLSW
jgi:hypothetical protein